MLPEAARPRGARQRLSRPLRASVGHPDIVLLVTPPATHLPDVTECVRRAIPILAEKPLAEDFAESIQMVKLAEEANVPLSLCLQFRYLPVSQGIRQAILQQTYGTPLFSLFAYMRNRDGSAPHLNKYPLTMRHPMLLEQTVHHYDLIRYCYDREPVRLLARTWNPPNSMYAHDANVSTLIQMEGGLEVNYLGTWSGGSDSLEFQWRTDCSDGVVVQKQLFSDLWGASKREPTLSPISLPDFTPFIDDTRALLADYVTAIKSGGPFPCTGRDHLKTLAMVFMAIESSETGRWVEVAEFEQRHGLSPNR